MIYAQDWRDYALLDVNNGNRLERWGDFIFIRPDPQVIWNIKNENNNYDKNNDLNFKFNLNLWNNADGIYMRSDKGGGFWSFNKNKKLPENWQINYEKLGLKFEVSPMGFKHMGVFPEQAANWSFLNNKIKNIKNNLNNENKLNILNLFAYTGGASLACAKAGANVVHVDASKSIINLAKRNANLSNVNNIRFIADDCVKFVEREIRRGHKYDGVILDPPSYGRGANGEMWKIEDDLFNLLKLILNLLNQNNNNLFVLLNLYTAGLAPSCAGYMLEVLFKQKFGGEVFADEIGIIAERTKIAFPCGAFARWTM